MRTFHNEENHSGLVLFLFVVLALIAMTLPYLVVYVIPFLVLSTALGWLLLKACYVADAKRNHARLAYLFPMLVILAHVTLGFIASETAKPVQEKSVTPRERVSKSRARKAILSIPIQSEVAVDSYGAWNESFNRIYHGWYEWLPLAGYFVHRNDRPSFNFEHFRWIIMSVVLFGMPISFLLFQVREAEYLNSGTKGEVREFDEWRAAKVRELQEVEKEFMVNEQKLHDELHLANRLIETYRLREKYLAELKPELIALTPECVDLSYL